MQRISSVMALGVLALVALTTPRKAEAGCWIVWQGLKSHVECDSAGVMPTFENLKRSLNEVAGLSSACKQSVLTTTSAYFSCGVAIVSAIKSGGATVWVGAGEACYKFSEELKANDRHCRQYVNLRTKPLSVRVCNGRRERIAVSLARREVREEKVSSGWDRLAPNECQTYTFANARVIYAMALTEDGRRIYPDYHTNDLDDEASFCINRRSRFSNLNVKTCHDRPEHNPYDYNKPGDLKFTVFGRVSGLSRPFTFR